MVNTGQAKNFKKILFEFFGMNEGWHWKRNLLGILMVHALECPTYFLPAYNQAKATGDAKILKKGEGIRGLLTGMLDGLAIGALVSGAKIRLKEIVPFIIIGGATQYIAAKFLPWIAENAGRQTYLKTQKKSILKQTADISKNQIKPVF